MNYKMDYVRSYVVPSLHYAEVVHLREDEDDETSISAASTSSSSSSVIEVETKTHRIEANSSLTSYESTHSIDIPSVFHNHSNLRILDELRRDSNDKKEIESLKLNNNNNIDSGLVNDENFQNTTEEIDIDAILGYPNSNEDSCLQNDTITVVDEELDLTNNVPSMDEELDLTNNVPSMDEDHEFRDEVKKKHSSPKKLKDKYSVFEKIKLTLSRKKYDQNDSELSSDEKGNQKKIDNIHNKGDSLNISDENHFGLVGEKKSFIKTMNKSPKNKVFQKSNGFGSGKRSPQKSFDNINDKNRIRCNSESSLDKRIDSKKHDYTQAADKNIHNKSNPVSDHEKSQSTGSSKFQSKFLLKKYSDMSLPRSRTERKSVEKDEKKFRMRSSSLPRTKFGLPNRRASLIRQPSTDHVVPKSEDSHDEPHSHEEVNSKMRTKSEPNIFENGISNRPENPRRQYGRRSGRFRRAPPSRQIITIQNRPHSSERSGVLTEEEKRLNGNEIRPRHRASSLPRLNSGSRQRRRSQGRNSAHSNDLCNIQ